MKFGRQKWNTRRAKKSELRASEKKLDKDFVIVTRSREKMLLLQAVHFPMAPLAFLSRSPSLILLTLIETSLGLEVMIMETFFLFSFFLAEGIESFSCEIGDANGFCIALASREIR